MVSGRQISQINFLPVVNQSENNGFFFCPACEAWVSLKGARWPGTPSIETVILDHFSLCNPRCGVAFPLLFFVNDMTRHMKRGLIVVERRPTNTGDGRERNLHIIQSAIAASQSRKQLACIITGQYVAEREGLETTFVFRDRTQFSIYESAADSLESLTLAAYDRLLRSLTRCAA